MQTKVKALLYSWKLGLPSEPKIAEAYEMLKRQGTCVHMYENMYLCMDIGLLYPIFVC